MHLPSWGWMDGSLPLLRPGPVRANAPRLPGGTTHAHFSLHVSALPGRAIGFPDPKLQNTFEIVVLQNKLRVKTNLSRPRAEPPRRRRARRPCRGRWRYGS